MIDQFNKDTSWNARIMETSLPALAVTVALMTALVSAGLCSVPHGSSLAWLPQSVFTRGLRL